MENDDGRSPAGRATAVEPVPVSPLRDGIPSAGAAGPEWQEMIDRHEREGVTYWHADRAPGVSLEQMAAEMNRLAKHLADPYNDIASQLRGEASLLHESADCTLNQRQWNGSEFAPVELKPGERGRAISERHLAELLISAAELLERHGSKEHSLAVPGDPT